MNGNVKINKFLLPFSWLYGAGVGLRNKLFDWKILPVEEFPIPVISIGNLSAGGTGKTPHTEYLVRLLQNDYRVAVLSRGYKRKSSGFILADENATPQLIGDESYQLSRKFPAVQIAVDSNRRRGIRELLNLPEDIRPEVILLDDAYQHRYVKPSLSILLTDYNRLYTRDRLLPAGRLREPAGGMERADIIIVTKCPVPLDLDEYGNESWAVSLEIDRYYGQKLFFSSVVYGELQAVFPSAQTAENKLSKEDIDSAILFSGIAYPQLFIDHVKSFVDHLEVTVFSDHHYYSQKDFKQLYTAFQNLPEEKKIVVTTEKDMVKLLDHPDFPKELKQHLYYIPIEITFKDSYKNDINEIIKNHVSKTERNR